jgi:hypothetical protein
MEVFDRVPYESIDRETTSFQKIIVRSNKELTFSRTYSHRPLVPLRRDSFEAQRALREGVFSGESVRGRFSRSPRPAAIDMPERLRPFDLVASHHQIKNDSFSASSASLR